MEVITNQVNDVSSEYQQIESDDSRSNASRSDDNEGVPGIIYTSDDSADVGQSDSTYIDSDAPHYYTQNVNEVIEDQLSQHCLLVSNSPLPQKEEFISHPLSPMNINRANNANKEARMQSQNANQLLADHPKIHLNVNPGEGLGLTRYNSSSSSSTEPEYTLEVPFLSEYEPLSCYPDDDGYGGGLNFEALKDDPVKSQALHEHFNLLTTPANKECHSTITTKGGKYFVAGVYIDAKYKDAFYVKWDWRRIRQSFVFIGLSLLIGLLCVSIGLLIQMPQKCDPVQEWWQGSVSYYIYVPSFQDSNGDGIGDLKGIINRLDYLEGLGVRTVRLGTIFEIQNHAHYSFLPSNYTTIARNFGDEEDLQLLAALLHERNMFLTLDFPLVSKEQSKVFNNSNTNGALPMIDLLRDVPNILYKWTKYGVDGFVFTDIDQLSFHPELAQAFVVWRGIMDRKSRRPYRRILSVPSNLFENLKTQSSSDLGYILDNVNLINVYLNISHSSKQINERVNWGTSWEDHPSNPWIDWTMGGIGLQRMSAYLPSTYYDTPHRVQSPTLGPTMFQLFLPGSVTLFYADEIYAKEVEDVSVKDASWASLMYWSGNADNGGFTNGNPWFSSMQDWSKWNVATLNESMDPLRDMIYASQHQVPLYINGIFSDVGDYHPKKSNNFKIKMTADDVIIMDRFYPRRNMYTIVMNLGAKTVKKDLSKLYYGGNVLASSHGKSGYIKFQEISLKPGEALACVLDK